jgi:hypothetical protein
MQCLGHAIQGICPLLYATHGLLDESTASYIGLRAILGRYVQSQMHMLKEAIDVLRIL